MAGAPKLTRSGKISLKISDELAYIWALAATCRLHFDDPEATTKLLLMEAIIALRQYGGRKALRPSELSVLLCNETGKYIEESTQMLLNEIAQGTDQIMQRCEKAYTGLLPGQVGPHTAR